MPFLQPFLTSIVIVGVLAALTPLCSAGYPPMAPTLQPYQVLSPAGTWCLDVKPSNRKGAGSASTTLTNLKSGEVAWKKMLPYTFWQACVNEEGVVAGFAYTKGPLGENDPRQSAGDFVVSFLNPQGVPMHEERSNRSPSSFGMGFYFPSHHAYRLFHDPGNHRMILLMADGLFRCYSMRDGTLKRAFLPESKGEASGYAWPEEIQFIPNKRLMLLQSNRAWSNGDKTTCTSCIQLIDDAGKTLWATSSQKTYGADKEWPFPEFRILLPEQPEEDKDPFANSSPPGQDPFARGYESPERNDPPEPIEVANFEVYFGDTGEKAKFRILDTSGDVDSPTYQVEEMAREKSEPPKHAPAEEEVTPPVDFPPAETKELARFQLTDTNGTPLSNLMAVALGPNETIHALAGKPPKIQVFDRDGKILRTLDPGSKHNIDTNPHSSSLGVDGEGEIFVRISDDYGVELNPFAGHFFRLSPDGSLIQKPLAPPSAELSDKIIIQPESNNRLFFGYGDKVMVTRRDENGSQVAALTHRADGQWLEYIQDVAYASDGTIAVRDSSMGDTFGGFTTPFPRLPSHLPAETVTIFSADGDPLRTLDFSSFGGLSKIAFDGHRILATYPYDSPTPFVYVLDDKGKPVGSLRIAGLQDREEINLRAFSVKEGKEILAVDLPSGMAFRLVMP